MMASTYIRNNLLRILAVLFVSYALLLSIKYKFVLKSTPPHIQAFHKSKTCPSVLSGMMSGAWKTRPLTKMENEKILQFLLNTHSRYMLPKNYQRDDGLCGNVPYLKSKNYRALCNPEGSSPCCFHNKCASKSEVECKCKDCYDLRSMKHAEYSKWIPSHPGCKYHEHSPQEACNILNGMDIAFIGDSLIRHVYTAMLLVVTGNMKDGAMVPGTDNATRHLCQGMYMFTEKRCRGTLNRSVNACGGQVKLASHEFYHCEMAKDFHNVTKTGPFLFTGIGVHAGFNHEKVQNVFLKPALAFLKTRRKKPLRLLWVAHHAPGILKSPIYMQQTDANVLRFNRQMESFLKLWNVPIFDTYNLTKGMMSFDGQHYGMGINIAKANLFLSFLNEQKAKNML